MKIGVIADDFTGASDIALTLAEGGMSVVQFVGVPSGIVKDVDAGVVSLKSRTAPLEEAIAQSKAACAWQAKAPYPWNSPTVSRSRAVAPRSPW